MVNNLENGVGGKRLAAETWTGMAMDSSSRSSSLIRADDFPDCPHPNGCSVSYDDGSEAWPSLLGMYLNIPYSC